MSQEDATAGKSQPVIRFRHDLGLMYHGFLTLYGRNRAIWVSALCALAVISVVRSYGKPHFEVWLWLNVIWFALGVAAFYLSPALTFRRLLREPTLAGEWIVSAEESGIHARGEQAEGTYQWSAFTRFVETPRAFVLRLGKQNFVVIPKSAFGSGNHLDSFRAAIEKNVP